MDSESPPSFSQAPRHSQEPAASTPQPLLAPWEDRHDVKLQLLTCYLSLLTKIHFWPLARWVGQGHGATLNLHSCTAHVPSFEVWRENTSPVPILHRQGWLDPGGLPKPRQAEVVFEFLVLNPYLFLHEKSCMFWQDLNKNKSSENQWHFYCMPAVHSNITQSYRNDTTNVHTFWDSAGGWFITKALAHSEVCNGPETEIRSSEFQFLRSAAFQPQGLRHILNSIPWLKTRLHIRASLSGDYGLLGKQQGRTKGGWVKVHHWSPMASCQTTTLKQMSQICQWQRTELMISVTAWVNCQGC